MTSYKELREINAYRRTHDYTDENKEMLGFLPKASFDTLRDRYKKKYEALRKRGIQVEPPKRFTSYADLQYRRYINRITGQNIRPVNVWNIKIQYYLPPVKNQANSSAVTVVNQFDNILIPDGTKLITRNIKTYYKFLTYHGKKADIKDWLLEFIYGTLSTSYRVTGVSPNNVIMTQPLRNSIDGMCYLDLLEHKAFKENEIKNKLIYWLKSFNLPVVSKQDFMNSEKYAEGFTMDEITEFLEEKKKSYVVYDALGRIIRESEGDKTIYLQIKNKHLTILHGRIQKKEPTLYKRKERSIKSKEISVENFDSLNLHNASYLKTSNHELTAATINNKTYCLINEDAHLIAASKDLFNSLSSNYKSRTDIHKFNNPTLWINTTGDLYNQDPNDHTIKNTLDWAKTKEIDIEKAYTSIVLNYGLPILSNTARWTTTKPDGFYYQRSNIDYPAYKINKNDVLPCYYDKLMNLQATEYLPCETFSVADQVKKLIKKYPNDFKIIVNSFVGMLGINYTVVNKATAILKKDSKIELDYYNSHIYTQELPQGYLLESIEKRENTYNYRPSFNFIIQMMNLKMIDMIQQLAKKRIPVLAYYCDAVFIDKSYNPKLTDNVTAKPYGRYIVKERDIPNGLKYKNSPKVPIIIPEKIAPMITTLERNKPFKLTYLRGQRILISAMPGAGKTTIINDFLDSLDPSLIVHIVAPSNCSAGLINGKTIHAQYGIAQDSYEIMKMPKRLDVLVIDEYSMISEPLWNSLMSIMCMPNLMVIVSGDSDQLPAVNDGYFIEASNYEFNQVVKINHSYRFNQEQANLSRDLLNSDLSLPELAEKLSMCPKGRPTTDHLRITTTNKVVESYRNKEAVTRWIAEENIQSLSICKNSIYILSHDKKNYILDDAFTHQDAEPINVDLLNTVLFPCKAVTVWKLQGQTVNIDTYINLADFYETWITAELRRKLLYVAITRGRSLPYVS